MVVLVFSTKPLWRKQCLVYIDSSRKQKRKEGLSIHSERSRRDRKRKQTLVNTDVNIPFKISKLGAGGMAQQFQAPVALVEDAGCVPSTHTRHSVICNSSSRRSDTLFQHPWATGTHVAHRHTCRLSIHVYKMKIIFLISKLLI